MNLPIPFEHEIYKKELSSINSTTFIVCAMFTPDKPKLFQYADRLSRSCEKYNLPFIVYKVPKIHKSITPEGQDDLAFTKANFIYFNLNRYPTKNILYLDVDVFLMEYPKTIREVSGDNYDFAIYNWLNDEHNEAYVPINRKLEAGNIYSGFYEFSHWIGYQSSEQLICSGATQFYRNSDNAKTLLNSWFNVIAGQPDYADDECLDYTFNNFFRAQNNFSPFWLDKSYCRYPWWIYSKPVVIHPDLPCGGRGLPLNEINNLKRCYFEKCKQKSNLLIFPHDYIIDTNKKLLLKIINNLIVDIKPIMHKLWIYPEDIALA